MRVDVVELQRELRLSLELGYMTEQFAYLAMEVAQGYYSARESGDLSATFRSDLLSDYSARLVNTWSRGDPDKNVFAWLTNKAKSVLATRARSELRYIARVRKWQAMHVDSLNGDYSAGVNTAEVFDGDEESS